VTHIDSPRNNTRTLSTKNKYYAKQNRGLVCNQSLRQPIAERSHNVKEHIGNRRPAKARFTRQERLSIHGTNQAKVMSKADRPGNIDKMLRKKVLRKKASSSCPGCRRKKEVEAAFPSRKRLRKALKVEKLTCARKKRLRRQPVTFSPRVQEPQRCAHKKAQASSLHLIIPRQRCSAETTQASR